MAYKSELPSEILTIVFQDLRRQDLVSCSRTCWAWNDTANSLLYIDVSLSTLEMFCQFINTITDVQSHRIRCVQNTMNRRQPVGLLVKVMDVSVRGYEWHKIHNYAKMLAKLVSKTPNVHTSEFSAPVYYPQCDLATRSTLDWRTVATQWAKLTNLTLTRSVNYCVIDENNARNINDALNRLQYLDVSSCDCISNYLLPSLPTMTHLQYIAFGVSTTSDYQALKTILKTCQSTLQTLIIQFSCLQPGSFDLDDLNIGYKQLKAFGLTTDDGSHISITSFGDNLGHFEWWSQRIGDSTRDHLSQAMAKTKNLKSLSLNDNISYEDIALALESNKNTLHTFYFKCFGANDLIVLLLENKVRLNKVTRLCFDYPDFQKHHVPLLAEVFPNVEFLALSRFRLEHEGSAWLPPEDRAKIDVRWIEMEALSHFKHLKDIDKNTSLELTDPLSVTYQTCDILPYGSIKRPRAMPMPFT